MEPSHVFKNWLITILIGFFFGLFIFQNFALILLMGSILGSLPFLIAFIAVVHSSRPSSEITKEELSLCHSKQLGTHIMLAALNCILFLAFMPDAVKLIIVYVIYLLIGILVQLVSNRKQIADLRELEIQE